MYRALIQVVVVSLCAVTAVAADQDASAVATLSTEVGTDAVLRLDPTTGVVRGLRLPPTAAEPATKGALEDLPDLLRRHARAFGLEDASRDLGVDSTRSDALGGRLVTYRQLAGGLPVIGGRLRTHFDSEGRLVAITSRVLPFSVAPPEGEISADHAARIARAIAASTAGANRLSARAEGLAVIREGALRGRSGGADRTVWQVAVEQSGIVIERIFVDSSRGTLVERIPEVEDLTRVIHHQTYPNPVWTEGDPRPFTGLGADTDAEVETLLDTAAEVNGLFANLSGGGYLSWDGDDAPMEAAVAYDQEDLTCPNAQWTGSAHYTRFCPGMATDDVVAHEWTHAYTSATHGLIYMWQSGALNESYSDIFGETVDLLNTTGFDDPDGIRTSSTCSAFAGGEPTVVILEPTDIAGEFASAGAAFNPISAFNVEADVQLVEDGSGRPNDGCQELIDFVPGRIAMVEFGSCLFYDPVARAEAAGAVGVIVVNRTSDRLVEMPGSGDRLGIPAVLVGKTDGAVLLPAADAGGLRARLTSAETSTRWLIGEDATTGVIRDMWAPGCEGNPGSVTDPTYWCDSSVDNGGVHLNSGIPNRAFALLVDGGEVDGVAVSAIGLTKATHLYWRAMTTYQLPISDFSDHADALAESCQDLLGQPLTDPETGAVSDQVMTAGDCDQVEAAITAVALRTPAPCNFATVLRPDPPVLRTPLTLLDEGFASALGSDWELTDEGVYDEYRSRSWFWRSDPPGGGDGGAMFAASDPTAGDCRPGSDDQSGVVMLTTPSVEVPEGIVAPTVVLDHYVATLDFPSGDGGNLKLSVNGGAFVLVPRETFSFNPYPTTLEAEDSTNPLAGESAFVGYDEGGFSGSWGQSQIDLSGRVEPGDTIRLRFDFGTDGCLGLDGWYLDRVRVLAAPAWRRGGQRLP
jgi:Zn-dependent metalloprotease